MMTTFVMIHAAFLGDWVWSLVSDHLGRMGHKVIAPMFASRCTGKPATLSTHVHDVLNIIDQLPGKRIVLVAQSYGGIVATALATRIPERVSCIIYVDGIIPEHGKSMLDVIPKEFRDGYISRLARLNKGDVILPSHNSLYSIRSDAHRSLVEQKMQPQSLASFEEPADLSLPSNTLASLPRHYIHCSAHSVSSSAGLYAYFAQKAATDRTWQYRSLPIGFYGVLNTPRILAETIVETVHGVSGGLSNYQIRRVLDTIEGDVHSKLSIVDLAEIAGLSAWHFARCFKKSMGVAPHAYISLRRIEIASRLLLDNELTVTEVSCQAGFNSPSRFSTAFRSITGITPQEFKKAHLPEPRARR